MRLAPVFRLLAIGFLLVSGGWKRVHGGGKGATGVNTGASMPGVIKVFGTDGFGPHGYCLTWCSTRLWLHVLSDLLIFLACYSIPIMLMDIVKNRKDFLYPELFIVFGLFIVARVNTHLLPPAYFVTAFIREFVDPLQRARVEKLSFQRASNPLTAEKIRRIALISIGAPE